MCITTALPVIAAITLARHQEVVSEQRHALDIANRVLSHAEMSGDQILAAAQAINALPPEQVCSPEGLALMRKIDLESTLLQAVGWVEGDVMRCSSLAGSQPFDLGPPDVDSYTRTLFRNKVTLIDPKQRYMVVQIGSAVGIVHRDLLLSFIDDIPGMSVGVFSWSHRTPGAVRGPVPSLIRRANLTGDTVISSGQYQIAIARSRKYDIGAFSMLPVGRSTSYVSETAGILIPLGVIVGLLLSGVLVYIVRSRASMPMMIRSALKQGKFHLLYQPVIELRSGRIVGAEALLRWDRGEHDAISPERFIAVAEDAGLIRLVTGRMLELLTQDAQSVVQIAPDFHFAVNFSAEDMHSAGIMEELGRLVAQSRIGFANLVIEATERSLVDIERTQQTMRRLREAGARVAIDDFGTGYSSLSYLAKLEIDFLKIDKLFVQSLGTDAATSQVAGRIIDMAKDLGLEIVA
ncbi:MAG TPA: EAL domain-containing protein, partial [Sphingomonadaceae bacterium]|nr:EAL domain-containing protein [Sphingomonadaceae bacterium]